MRCHGDKLGYYRLALSFWIFWDNSLGPIPSVLQLPYETLTLQNMSPVLVRYITCIGRQYFMALVWHVLDKSKLYRILKFESLCVKVVNFCVVPRLHEVPCSCALLNLIYKNSFDINWILKTILQDVKDFTCLYDTRN